MNYKLLETFAVLAKTLNITKTAEKLYLSQSAVSYRLKTLEDELGITLVERDRGFKHIKLTDHGKDFMSIVLDWEIINDRINNFSSSSFKKTVSIGVVDSVNNYLFRKIYKEIFKNPNVKLTIKTQHTDEIYEQVAARIIDIGFVLHNIPMNQIEHKEILDEKMVLVTKSKNMSNSKSIDPKNLNPEEQIFLNWGDQYLKWHNKYFSQGLNPKLVTDSTLLSFDLLDQDSWLIVPISAAYSLTGNFEDITIIPFIEDPPHRSIYMITNKAPLYSNREAIEDFTTLVDKHMDAHRIWQNNFLNKLNNEG
ncbi:LysR family transcriptional regulator [Mesobacillus maritimus]|uniref:LysR family transcriptional regulator n=1 Tax=Mesobacillus maritimus TaxID=1643336 RepID=UPI00384AF76E